MNNNNNNAIKGDDRGGIYDPDHPSLYSTMVGRLRFTNANVLLSLIAPTLSERYNIVVRKKLCRGRDIKDKQADG